MKSAGLSFIFAFYLWFAGAADAQLADPDGAGERNGPAGAAPTSRAGEEEPQGDTLPPNPSSICQALASAAAANGLPFEFFARVIWQESRFRSDAVGPVTRSGQRAQGIAQFMPATAAERLLHDPFDPAEALPKSAEYLRELLSQFGNLGLAAAAYNAGPQRVRDWLTGRRTLPSETETYVRMVTGRSAQEWTRPEQPPLQLTVPREMSCSEIAKLRPKPQSPYPVVQPKPTPAWVIQLVGDRSEIKALVLFRQLQKKHEALLKVYEPEIIRTTLRGGAAPIWSRIRIDVDSRQAAQSLCSTLRAAGEVCLVQRN